MYQKLQKILKDQPPYRLNQAKNAIFKELITNWNQTKSLPKPLQDILNKNYPLDIPHKIIKSSDKKTQKAIVTLFDNLQIEAVLLNYQNRITICISTQVGCPLNCSFCATGKMGFFRNLETKEIVDQVLLFQQLLKDKNNKVDNIVFMGMGEPLLNFDNTLNAIQIINDPKGLGIGQRHISISTAGIIPGIRKLADKSPQINLAISLHAPNNPLRDKLMPINKKYPLDKLIPAIKDYLRKTNRKVMFEYLLIENINDNPKYAYQLIKLLDHPLFFVNLVSYNPTGSYQPSSSQKVTQFKNILLRAGLFTTQRYRFGQDINAACGQLATKKSKE